MSDDLVVVPECTFERGVLTLTARPYCPVRDCPSTLPKDAAGLIRRLNAMGASTLELDKSRSLLILVADVLAYPVDDRPDEEGEVRSYCNLVLIDPAGERFVSSSPVLQQKFAQIVALWSAGELPRPLGVQIIERTGRKSGRRYHDVVILNQQGCGDGSDSPVHHDASPGVVGQPADAEQLQQPVRRRHR